MVFGVAINAPHMVPLTDAYALNVVPSVLLKVIRITSPNLNCGEEVPVNENEVTYVGKLLEMS